jgi:hypothetical protein
LNLKSKPEISRLRGSEKVVEFVYPGEDDKVAEDDVRLT